MAGKEQPHLRIPAVIQRLFREAVLPLIARVKQYLWCCIIKLDTSLSRIYKKSSEDGGQNGTEKSLRQKELGINVDTLYGWSKAANEGRLDLGPGTHTPDTAMSLTEEVQKLRQQNRDLAKENARLKEENEFLAEASAFFAASRRKSPKT